MRKPTTLKPKIWGSTATLHFWEPKKNQKNEFYTEQRAPNDPWSEGFGADVEQISHGRWAGSLDNFKWFNPTILGASPFERRAVARKR